jgi:hypothetical protein
MMTSSTPEYYSITSSDTITLDTSAVSTITTTSGTVDLSSMSTFTFDPNMSTVSNAGLYYPNSGGIGPLTGTSISTLTTSQISALGVTSTFSFKTPEEWVDQFPDWHRVQRMCEEYPGLKIAYEKFKTVYKLVKDHYDTPEDARPRP